MENDYLEPFLATLRASNLIDDIRLRESVALFKATLIYNANARDAVTALKEFLVSQGTLTRWQCEKLSLGKFRGFILDYYVLLEPVRARATSTLYSARDQRTGEIVTLQIETLSAENPDVVYQLVVE